MNSTWRRHLGCAIAVSALLMTTGAAGQERFRGDIPREYVARIDPGSLVAVRTNEPIEVHSRPARIFPGSVDQDVRDRDGRVVIPAGSPVELDVRAAADGDLILDLDSIIVNGERYAVRADVNRVEAPERHVSGEDAGKYIGGGAILGTIVGALAGGGKGAAIGAVAGAAAGGALLTRGREIRVPADAVLTFRLDRPLDVGVPDTGYDRDGFHWHDR